MGLGVPTASAHIGVLEKSAQCDDNGTPLITYPTGTISFTNDCTPPVVVPGKPEPLVVVTSSDAQDCESRTVTTTTVTTTTDWVLKDNVWVNSTPVVTQTEVTRPATTEECPVVVPEKPAPVDVTPVEVLGVSAVAPRATPAVAAVKPLPTAAAAGDADTSGQLFAGYLASLAAMLMLGAGYLLRRRQGEV
jgi:hypothetical protein